MARRLLAVDPVAEEAVLCQAVQEPEMAAAGGLKPLVAQLERELERVRSVLEAERQAVEEGPPVDADDAPVIGKEMTSNPIVRKLGFTGSTEIGKLLMEQCAAQVKKVVQPAGKRVRCCIDSAETW